MPNILVTNSGRNREILGAQLTAWGDEVARDLWDKFDQSKNEYTEVGRSADIADKGLKVGEKGQDFYINAGFVYYKNKKGNLSKREIFEINEILDKTRPAATDEKAVLTKFDSDRTTVNKILKQKGWFTPEDIAAVKQILEGRGCAPADILVANNILDSGKPDPEDVNKVNQILQENLGQETWYNTNVDRNSPPRRLNVHVGSKTEYPQDTQEMGDAEQHAIDIMLPMYATDQPEAELLLAHGKRFGGEPCLYGGILEADDDGYVKLFQKEFVEEISSKTLFLRPNVKGVILESPSADALDALVSATMPLDTLVAKLKQIMQSRIEAERESIRKAGKKNTLPEIAEKALQTADAAFAAKREAGGKSVTPTDYVTCVVEALNTEKKVPFAVQLQCAVYKEILPAEYAIIEAFADGAQAYINRGVNAPEGRAGKHCVMTTKTLMNAKPQGKRFTQQAFFELLVAAKLKMSGSEEIGTALIKPITSFIGAEKAFTSHPALVLETIGNAVSQNGFDLTNKAVEDFEELLQTQPQRIQTCVHMAAIHSPTWSSDINERMRHLHENVLSDVLPKGGSEVNKLRARLDAQITLYRDNNFSVEQAQTLTTEIAAIEKAVPAAIEQLRSTNVSSKTARYVVTLAKDLKQKEVGRLTVQARAKGGAPELPEGSAVTSALQGGTFGGTARLKRTPRPAATADTFTAPNPEASSSSAQTSASPQTTGNPDPALQLTGQAFT